MAKHGNWNVIHAGARPRRGWLCGEPTIEELLDDSVLRTMLRSDGIDPARFRAFIDELRGRDRARRRCDRIGDGSSPAPRIRAAGGA